MEEDHNTVYFIPPLQSSTEKEELAVKAGEDTGVEKGLQAGKEKKALVVGVCKKVTSVTFLHEKSVSEPKKGTES